MVKANVEALYSLPRVYADIPLDALNELLDAAAAMVVASDRLTVAVERNLISNEVYLNTKSSEAVRLQFDDSVPKLLIQLLAEVSLKLHLEGDSARRLWIEWVEKGYFHRFDSYDVETLAQRWLAES